MATDDIARVVNDIRTGIVANTPEDLSIAWHDVVKRGPVVDVTNIYKQVLNNHDEYVLEERYTCVLPPWDFFHLAYENQYGNVIVISNVWHDDIRPWETINEVNWDEVKLTLSSFIFVGGYGRFAPDEHQIIQASRRRLPTSGPMWLFTTAIGKAGEILDSHWVAIQEGLSSDPETWTVQRDVIYASLNFLNCRNVKIIEPKRERHEAKRLQRLNVQLHEISVFPIGKTYRSTKSMSGSGVPLTSVRGHFAEYGPEYGKGKLFGKLEGRFWIPMHARGTEELGVSQHNYKLEP